MLVYTAFQVPCPYKFLNGVLKFPNAVKYEVFLGSELALIPIEVKVK